MAPSRLWSARAGTGPPLLLLHGVGATHADFTQVFDRLSTEFDVIAVDLPGHGASAPLDTAPNVPALTDAIEAHLDELGVGTVHVLGNSLGGRIALELACRRRARSVLAISPFGPASPAERLVQGGVLVGAGAFVRALRPCAPALSRHWWGRCVLLGGVRAQPWRAQPVEAEGLGLAMGTREYWRTLVANATDLPAGLEAITCPVTLAQGTSDWLSASMTMRYARMIPGATMSWLLFAGHAAQGDRPSKTIALMRATAARAPSS